MPAFSDAGKNLVRLREISAIVARHGFGRVLDRARIFETLGIKPKLSEEAERHSAPERFRDLLAELGPTFVKLGQVLSSRADILPPDWIRALSTLQDQVPPMPRADVHRVIEEGLGKPVSALFSELADDPIASASIGQVHAAKLLDGSEVVVKIQRPGITERIRADLDLLYYFAQLLERIVEETGIYTPTGIVGEFEKSLKAELDYSNEAANLRLFRANHEGREWMVIPRVYDDFTSKTVLTMERLRGDKITECTAPWFDPKKCVTHLVEGIFQQLFTDGWFHADPHPGNLFVLEGNRIGLVDFGLVGRVSKQMQENIVVLCLAVALNDPDTVARLVYKTGVPDERVNLAQFRADIAEILEGYRGLRLHEIRSVQLVNAIVELALKYRIKVPKEYAVLTKAAITIEGLVRTLHPEMDVIQVALPYAEKLITERMSPKGGQTTLLRSMLQAQTLANEIPLQLAQILMDVEGGKLPIQIKSKDLEALVGAIRWLGIALFSGMMAAALTLGSFVVLAAQTHWEIGGVPVLGLVGVFVPPILFSGALMWALLGGKTRKISVRRFFGKGQ